MKRRRISAYVKLYFLMMAIFLVIGCGGGGGGGGAAATTYTISGSVSGAILANVTINLSGTSTSSATSGSAGDFSFKSLKNGTYTVTPVLAGYYFNPVSSVVVVSGANVTGANFTAYATGSSTYSLSGTVSGVVGEGVKITLGGTADAGSALVSAMTVSGPALSGTVVTDSSGNYSFSNLPKGNYNVTPSLTGYDFAPSTRSVTISGNSTGNNFTSTVTPEPTYIISGKVGDVIKEGVSIQLTGAATKSTTTDADGNYSFSGLYNGSYTVTPSMDGYTFSPTSTAVTLSGANQTGKNFTATKVPVKYTISGTVTGDILKDVTMTLSGDASGTTTTNDSGNYSFSNIVNGSYTVTPSATGYTFSPTSRAVAVSDGNATADNFVATAKPSVTWKEFMLATSTSSTASWRRRTLKFDSSTGILFTASSCLNSSGSTTCPGSGTLTWTNSAGVISESGSSADSTVHMTITSTGNFIAGTGGSSSSPHLRVAMKVVPGTVYTNADLQSKSFVFHEMVVGSSTMWRHGKGATDALGAITLSSVTDISGTTGTDTSWGTMTVDANGWVTIGGTGFQGFLADDKKTIVGVYTSGTTYRLMILQITARNDYPAGPLPASTWKSSFLAKSTSIPIVGVQAGWIYCTNTVDGSGNMSFGTDWTSSNSQFSSNRPTTAFTGSITLSGEVTMTDSSYNGQASDDWNFLVGTMTLVTDVNLVGTVTIYLLQVSTR